MEVDTCVIGAKYMWPVVSFWWEKLYPVDACGSLESPSAGHGLNPDLEKLSLYIVEVSILSKDVYGRIAGLVLDARVPGVPVKCA